VSLASAERQLGLLGEAEAHARQAVAIKEATYDPDHREVATALTELGQICVQLQQLPLAKQLLERSLAIQQREFGEEHVRVAETLTALGQLQGDGTAFLERALTIQMRAFGADHPRVAHTLTILDRVREEIAEVGSTAALGDDSGRTKGVLPAPTAARIYSGAQFGG
jgi:tetratricopeptide (TPR) repeat protein